MKSVSDHIRDHLLKDMDFGEVGDKADDYESLKASEWSSEFEQLMRNRLIMGRFRYGRMDRTDQLNYDRIGSAIFQAWRRCSKMCRTVPRLPCR